MFFIICRLNLNKFSKLVYCPRCDISISRSILTTTRILLCYLLGCLEPPIQTKLRRRTLSISWQFLIHNKIHLFLRLSTSYLKDNVLIPEARKKHKVPYIQLWCYRTSCLSLWVSPPRICLARGRPRLACLCSPRWPTEPAGRPGFLSSILRRESKSCLFDLFSVKQKHVFSIY